MSLCLLKKCVAALPKIVNLQAKRFIGFGDSSMPDKLYKTIALEAKSCEKAVLESYGTFICSAAKNLQIAAAEPVFCKKPSKHRITVLKSAFVHRKHLVTYEVRTYYMWIYLNKLTGSTADTFLEYIERMLPEGVGLKVSRTSVEPLPSHLSVEHIKKSGNFAEVT